MGRPEQSRELLTCKDGGEVDAEATYKFWKEQEKQFQNFCPLAWKELWEKNVFGDGRKSNNIICLLRLVVFQSKKEK